MPKKNRLAENIRILLNVFDEQQKDLAAALGVSPTAVSVWANGKKKPSAEMLERIATRYSVTIAQLQYSDMSDRHQIQFLRSKQKLLDISELALPCLSSDSAMDDPHFVTGHRAHQQLLTTTNEVAFFHFLNTAIDEYRLSVEENRTAEAACNLVALLFRCASIYQNPELGKKLANAPDNSWCVSSIFKRLSLGDMQYRSESDEENLLAFARDIESELKQLLTLIRSSTVYRDYAEFYLALKYYIGLVDNECDQKTNNRIAGEMLWSFAELGNKVAQDFIVACFSDE